MEGLETYLWVSGIVGAFVLGTAFGLAVSELFKKWGIK